MQKIAAGDWCQPWPLVPMHGSELAGVAVGVLGYAQARVEDPTGLNPWIVASKPGG